MLGRIPDHGIATASTSKTIGSCAYYEGTVDSAASQDGRPCSVVRPWAPRGIQRILQALPLLRRRDKAYRTAARRRPGGRCLGSGKCTRHRSAEADCTSLALLRRCAAVQPAPAVSTWPFDEVRQSHQNTALQTDLATGWFRAVCIIPQHMTSPGVPVSVFVTPLAEHEQKFKLILERPGGVSEQRPNHRLCCRGRRV